MLRVAVACSWPFGCSVLNTVPSGASGPVLCRVVMVWPLFRVLSLHRTVQWYSTVPSGARLFLWFSVWPGALPVIHTIQSGAPPPDRPVCTSRAGLLAIQPVFSRVFGHLFRCVVPPLCVGDHCPAQVREERWGFFELQFRVESFNRLLFTPPLGRRLWSNN